ncbi:MAG TPA: SDR family NAD(P)-dependent oxidoreductase [Streptosporangiaceae bacterium]
MLSDPAKHAPAAERASVPARGAAASARETAAPGREAAASGPGGGFRRVLLIGGTSEIGLAILQALRLSSETEVLLAGRDAPRIRAAPGLPGRVTVLSYEATDPAAYHSLAAAAFAGGPVDLVISAAGVLLRQDQLDGAPDQAGLLIQTNLTSHVTALLAIAAQMRRRGRGTIVILSSVAAVRPRKANFVYGAAKAGLDAFGRGLADSLHRSGVRVLLVRPGFVIGRMTAGLRPAPLATTPDRVGQAVAAALAGTGAVVWVPRSLGPAAIAMRLIPRPLWRRLRM